MQDRLFRDWRYALLWVIGISACVAAYFADGGGHEDLARGADQIRSAREGEVVATEPSAPAQPAASGTPAAAEEEDEPRFGEPQLVTEPEEPSPDEGATTAPTQAPAAQPSSGQG